MPAGRPTGADRLRVAVDATPLLGARSGIGVVTFHLLEALAARPDVRILAYSVSWRGRREIVRDVPSGVVTSTRPMPDRPLHLAWEHLGWPPIEYWTGATDVVHGTNYDVPPSRRAATVVTVNDLAIVRFPDLCQPATRPYPGRVRRAIERGAFVHTPSAFVAAETVELLGAHPERVRVVHYGVPPVSARPPGQTGVDGRYILAVGTIEARKDHPTLVRAFDQIAAAHPDVRLVIAGGEGGAGAALGAAIDAAHHRGRIELLGRVDDARRDALLASASVLAYPSRYEGFGLPPLEAMTVGVPVVATTGGSLPEVLGDGALLVPPADPEALAAALATVLDDDAVRSDLIARGRRWAAQYSWADCAQGLEDLYRSAAAG
ncbi:MAG TPA: glycosyltransferase family 1 protein [Acidimicrobiales bacterium]|jgi:glycosyltransferase involved in cell wall biosynthesis|nr:glycosyltransferase family 1 protein [Acidimicrobiales bacterium]